MKKLMCLLIAVMICAMLFAAGLAEESVSFADLADKVFYFSSGVGGWHTELLIAEDGSFTGSFSDSEMGDTGEGYPNGTVYGCDFHGRFELGDPAEAAHTWNLSLAELELDEGQVPESIEDGIRYVTSEEPYGLKLGNPMLLYTPGADTAVLSEEAKFWFHLDLMDEKPETLPFYGIYDTVEETAFVGEPKFDTAP